MSMIVLAFALPLLVSFVIGILQVLERRALHESGDLEDDILGKDILDTFDVEASHAGVGARRRRGGVLVADGPVEGCLRILR